MNSSNFIHDEKHISNTKSFNQISPTNKLHSNNLVSESESDSESETVSIQTLSTYYNSRLTNIKLIYLIITFVNILIGFIVFFEHKKILYSEFRFLYLYVILSITYWPVSILIAGILIVLKSLKEKFQFSTNKEEKENSLMLKIDTLSLTNYNSYNNYYYSYLMGFFLFILLGFYIICIPTSFYILYNLFNSQRFYLHIYKYYNIYLFVLLNLSKSIAIAICCLFLFFQKYKSNKIKLDLDEEFVKKVEEEIEQVKKCSGIFVADLNSIKKNEMFNRQTFLVTMQSDNKNGLNQIENENSQIVIHKNYKQNYDNSHSRKNSHIVEKSKSNFYNSAIVNNNSGSHTEFIKKPDLSSFLNVNNSDQANNHNNNTNFSQVDITPDKNKFIIPQRIDSSYIGNYNNYNYNFNYNINLNINPLNDSIMKKEIISKDFRDDDKVTKFTKPVRMSEKKTQIKDMIRRNTMITKNKESFINDMKKKLKLDSNNDTMRRFSNRNSLNEDNVSPYVLNRVSKNFLEFREMARDEQNNENLQKELDLKTDKKANRQVNIPDKKLSPIGSKAKDDMDLIYHNYICSNSIITAFQTEGNIRPTKVQSATKFSFENTQSK